MDLANMPRPSHTLKAYTGEWRKPLVFCESCGREEDEGLNEPCPETFFIVEMKSIVDKYREPKVKSKH